MSGVIHIIIEATALGSDPDVIPRIIVLFSYAIDQWSQMIDRIGERNQTVQGEWNW